MFISSLKPELILFKSKMNQKKKTETECSVCNKKFSTFSNLKKHVKKYHPGKISKLQSYYKNSNNFNYTCNCGKNFNHLRHFRSHQRTHSDQIEHHKFTRRKCPLCDYYKFKKSEMLSHFQEIHKINIVSKEYLFSSIEQFNKWKIEIESNSSSSYVQNAKSNKADTKYYCCHRSGSYVPKGKGVRQLKIKGTNKINAYCPAGIRLNKNTDGSYKVLLIKSHIGHETDLEHLQLTPLERKDLAIKIAAGMSFDEILNDIKQSAYSDVTKRIHLLTKKDLHNIESCFNRSSDAVKRAKEARIDKKSTKMHTTKSGEVSETEVINTNSSHDDLDMELQKKQLDKEKEDLLAEFSKHLNSITSPEKLEDLKAMLKSFSNY